MPYLIVIGLAFFVLTIYIVYRINTSGRRLIPISVLGLIAGMMLKNKRLSEKWSTVLWTALGSFLCSFIVFLPGKREPIYSFDHHIQMWPYAFIFIFILSAIVFHGDKIVPKLTEGLTFLQSIAVVYWVVDHGFIASTSLGVAIVMLIGLLFSLYSLLHAFTHWSLSRGHRLALSIWSCLVMALFAIDNMYRVYHNEQIENAQDSVQAYVSDQPHLFRTPLPV